MALSRPTALAAVRDCESEAEIAAILLGGACTPADPASFTRIAIRHGMAPLLIRAGVTARLPQAEARRLMEIARERAVVTEIRNRELERVLGALHHHGIDALVVKGAHLGNFCYEESYLRTRLDADLVVRKSGWHEAGRVLEQLGYRRQPDQTGDVVLGQATFDLQGGCGAPLDVHWRFARPHVAAQAFEFDDLFERSVPLPRLSKYARGPARADALAIACVHQIAHHPGQERLIWMYDLHLLTRALTEDEIGGFVRMAVSRGITQVCASAVGRAAGVFPSAGAAALLAALRAECRAEPSAALIGRRRGIDDVWADLKALRGWRERGELVAGHLLPPAAYMRTHYAPSSRAPLPWLYLRRVLCGMRGWF